MSATDFYTYWLVLFASRFDFDFRFVKGRLHLPESAASAIAFGAAAVIALRKGMLDVGHVRLYCCGWGANSVSSLITFECTSIISFPSQLWCC
jgi:hypothetical protein